MLTEEEILFTLDNHRNGFDPAFVDLEHPYVFPIDSRLNVFSNHQGKWAIAIEVLGYNVNADPIGLEITYYGNCLCNLIDNAGNSSNSYFVLPIDESSYSKTMEFGYLQPNAEYWLVRGEKIKLSYSKQDYFDAGIELKEYEPNSIAAEEVARLLVTRHPDLFRATDEELYRSIPKDLEKIMVINEWHHRNFYQNNFDLTQDLPFSIPTPEEWEDALEKNCSKLDEMNIPKEALLNAFNFEEQNQRRIAHNKEEWDSNRPGSYETWQLIAKVLVTGDASLYKPTLAPTSHWRNWPEAGYM